MASQQEKREMDAKAREGKTVVPGGTGGKIIDAQQRLAKGRSKEGQTRKEQLGTEGYKEMGRKGGSNNSGAAEDEGIVCRPGEDEGIVIHRINKHYINVVDHISKTKLCLVKV